MEQDSQTGQTEECSALAVYADVPRMDVPV
jgi:hypothetical protein